MSPLWLHLPAYAGTLETGFCTWVGVQLARVEWSLCSRPNEPEKRYALAFTFCLSNVFLNSCRSQFQSQCTGTRSPRSNRLRNLILRSEAIFQNRLEMHRKLRVWRRAHVRNRSIVARPRSQIGEETSSISLLYHCLYSQFSDPLAEYFSCMLAIFAHFRTVCPTCKSRIMAFPTDGHSYFVGYEVCGNPSRSLPIPPCLSLFFASSVLNKFLRVTRAARISLNRTFLCPIRGLCDPLLANSRDVAAKL